MAAVLGIASTCIDLPIIIYADLYFFQIHVASNKNQKVCSLVAMVIGHIFYCMTAFSLLEVHGKTFDIVHFDTL